MADVAGTLAPFTFHWYTGADPPLLITDEKTVLVPAQTGPVCVDVMLIAGVTTGLTLMVNALLVAVAGLAQVLLLVSRQVTTSPFASVAEL